MRGPYHPDLYDVSRPVDSWWRASAGDAPVRPALDGAAEADVAIIGAGYAGLAVARRLGERGIGALLLEAGDVGWGASGRNGGIVGLSSDKLSEAERVARWGADEAHAYALAMVDGAERLRAFCAERGVETQGDAEAVVAHHPRAFAALVEEARAPRAGVSLEVLSKEAYAERGFAGPEQHGAMLVRPGFGVHPLQLVRAVAAEAEARGAVIHPFSEVVAWRREGALHLLETARGVVRARRVVLATNGFTPDDLHPAFAGRAMPVLSMIGVTRPLTPEELARHGWRETAPLANTRRMLYYFRMLPQGRLLFGMRGDLGGAEASAPAFRGRVSAHVARMFPGWSGVPLDYFWRGPVCATRDYAPAVGRLADDPTVFHAFGWHGSGVNGAQVAGRLLADVIAGDPPSALPAPFRNMPPRIPLPGLRRLWLGAMLAVYRTEDAWEER